MQKRIQKETISDDAILFHGDCLDILPELSGIDAVIADPPYSSGGMTHSERMRNPSDKYQSSDVKKKFADFEGDNRDQRSWTLWMWTWLHRLESATKDGAMYCLFTDWRQLPATTDALQFAGLIWRGLAVWDKINARPMPNRFRQQAEFIVWGTKGSRSFEKKDAEYLDGVFRHMAPSTKERKHMNQKPVPLIECLCRVARKGEVVLDPFMGSGSTGVACVRSGRKFIGIEKSQHYFDVARRRIEEEYNNL